MNPSPHPHHHSKKKLKRKMWALAVTFIFALALFVIGLRFDGIHQEILRWGYAGIFLAGLFYTYSFTAVPASALLLLIGKSGHIVVALLCASVGALVGDIVAYKIFKLSSRQKTADMTYYHDIFNRIHTRFPHLNNKILRIAIVAVIFMSPLPNELGNFILSRSREISFRMFLGVSFILNALGILVLLYASHFIP